MIGHGIVQKGTILFSKPVPLPDGTTVVVQIAMEEKASCTSPDEFSTLSFFGMYASSDMEDSVAWVRQEREWWKIRLE